MDISVFAQFLIQKFFSLFHSSAELKPPQLQYANTSLRFSFEPQENYALADAKLNIYLRGIDWLKKHARNTYNQLGGRSDIEIQLLPFKPSMAQKTPLKFALPKGDGRYVKFNLKSIVQKWFQEPHTMHGIVVNVLPAGANRTVPNIAVIGSDDEFVSI